MTALAFAIGDWAFRAYTGADIVSGLLVAFGLTLFFGGLALVAKIATDRLEESDQTVPSSLGQALRK